jgi:hypothetical protein
MSIMTLTLMFILGFLYAKFTENIKKHIRNKKIIEDILIQFKEILENIKKNQAVFISRVNQTVMIDTRLKQHDVVNIVYLMDKKVVCIFKENKCIYTSDTIDNNLRDNIIENIHEKYGTQIDDVVEVLGVTISREELESKLKDFENANPKLDMTIFNNDKEISDVEKIIEDNNEKFDIDSILDKINKVGMEKITKEELNFLKEQSKK